jgi:MoxR-like ATPase
LVWQRVAQAWALLRGRSFVTPDDIQKVALPMMRVRLAGDFTAVDAVAEEVLQAVPVESSGAGVATI